MEMYNEQLLCVSLNPGSLCVKQKTGILDKYRLDAPHTFGTLFFLAETLC